MYETQYPERKCREPMFSAMGMAYTCDVVDRHPGPHASFSLPETVERRTTYEHANPDWKSKINTDDFLA